MSGVFGIMGFSNCVQKLFYGVDYHSHLGTQYGGLAVWGEGGIPKIKIHGISNSQFKSKFQEDYHDLEGNMGIGAISSSHPQPLSFLSRAGPFCLCIDGQISNKDDIVNEVLERGGSFSEPEDGTINDAEIIAKLISSRKTFRDGIEYVFERVEGSVSLLLMCREGIYAARDPRGRNPLSIGRSEGSWVAATETSSFCNLGFAPFKDVSPGEIILIGKDGPEEVKEGCGCGRICTFLWIYTGFPPSDFEGVNTEIVRERCGSYLAKRDNIVPDIVSGVPDSGVGHAIGYAMESERPYRRPLVKYTPGYGRSYTPPDQTTRDWVAQMKLIPNRAVIQGNSIVVCEDSIVRGTQLKNFAIKKLWDCGAKEIHVRVACPPLLFPCRYNISTRSRSELAARKAIMALLGRDFEDISTFLDHKSPEFKSMVEWIRIDQGITSLQYQTLEDMISAIGIPEERLCTYCWTGRE